MIGAREMSEQIKTACQDRRYEVSEGTVCRVEW